jgi:hypothetical protein
VTHYPGWIYPFFVGLLGLLGGFLGAYLGFWLSVFYIRANADSWEMAFAIYGIFAMCVFSLGGAIVGSICATLIGCYMWNRFNI